MKNYKISLCLMGIALLIDIITLVASYCGIQIGVEYHTWTISAVLLLIAALFLVIKK